MPLELDIVGGSATDERRERVEPADLVRERVGEGVITGREPRPLRGPPMQGVGGERDEPGDRDRGPQDVEQLDGGGAGGEEMAVVAAMVRHDIDR